LMLCWVEITVGSKRSRPDPSAPDANCPAGKNSGILKV
jgi:hypothetical protein